MRTEEITIYKYDELSENAKEKAREWFKNSDDFQETDGDFILEDSAEIAALFGLDLKRNKKWSKDNKSFDWETSISYRGFYCQGDGANFKGSYSYQKGGLKAVKAHAPNDSELHRIVKGFQDLQKSCFYSVECNIETAGHYCHEYSMQCSFSRVDDKDLTEHMEEDFKELFRDFARWIYSRLKEAYEYTQTDEYAEEGIKSNEYEFNADGSTY